MATTAFPASNPLAVSGYNAGNVATLVPDLPSLTFTRNGTAFTTASAAGTSAGPVGNVPAGVTPTISPNDGRFVIAGSEGAWTVVRGMTAITAGTIVFTVNAAGANSVSGSVDVSAAAGSPAAFSMTQLAAPKRVYQRATTTGGGQSKGAGVIPVALNVTTAGQIYARCRSAVDGTTIVQASWLAVANASVANGAVNIPGVDARLGWFYVDLSGDGVTWTNGTTAVGMGRLVGISGQSLAVRLVGHQEDATTMATLGVAISPNTSAYVHYVESVQSNTSPAWATPADGTVYDSAFLGEFLRREVEKSSVNCGMIGAAQGATSISLWVPGGSKNTTLRDVLTAVGGFEAFYWFQGHSDAKDGQSYAWYQARLAELFNDLTAYNGVRGANYVKYLSSIPNINSVAWGTPTQQREIRSASREWAEANSGVYVDMHDITQSDNVHENMAGAVTIARHLYRATRPEFGLPHGDKPNATVVSASRSSGALSNIVLQLNADADPLVSNDTLSYTRFGVYDSDAQGLVYGISSIAIDNTAHTITLTLASGTTNNSNINAYSVFVFWNGTANPQRAIYSTVTDADDDITVGRAMWFQKDPIPVPALASGVPTSRTVGTTSGTAKVGSLLTGTAGTWNGNPDSRAYQWYWADTTAPISGATSLNYTPVSGDIGHTLRRGEVASRSGVGSSTEAFTVATAAVVA